MDEITWVRQQRIKKAAGPALGIAGILFFAALASRPFRSDASPVPPPPPHGLLAPPPHHPRLALSAAQIAASVATATKAHPGLVTKADGERDDQGRNLCLVDVQGEDGAHYHIGVDVASDTVLKDEAH